MKNLNIVVQYSVCIHLASLKTIYNSIILNMEESVGGLSCNTMIGMHHGLNGSDDKLQLAAHRCAGILVSSR